MTCNHKRTGIAMNESQAGEQPLRAPGPMLSVAVCERPACREKTRRYIGAEMNERAIYIPDADRSVREVLS